MIFYKTLNNWYSNNKRDLPWRQTTEPYYIWLSEIILQQTQVKQGLPYYRAFTAEFPSVFHLAEADESQVLKLWQGLGYYSRARNLHTTAKYVANELNGKFPDNYKALLKLKGVGDYTASAIASICFNEPSAVVDGNVYRVLSRYFGIDTPINTTQGQKEFKALAQELIDKQDPATFNQAIMEFGATHCKPKNPNCDTCPFINKCIAYSKGEVENLPVKLKANKAKTKYFNFLVILSENNQTVLEQRKGKGIWQNLYQFPLLETKSKASFEDVLELAKAHPILKDKPFELSLYNKETIVHKLSHQHLHTKFWIVKLNSSIDEGVSFETVTDYAVPILIGNFIEAFDF
ncbi:A/G-specific adenine glycosylase [Aestuariibaculum suncheonense]|uniref:Adenine DNA glycosylase n=1 Tax=Aestuariibaculum suncheonense TaxID=1028745 RepID=A0A8J6U9C7_9FLAO|nr:A/G-specific adenine glycosylase [Aestuariibaculum suncheonense]MBD0834043.1 A/G-specific adenine glycosylase [Aestuariibaculum suncheonense]